MLRRPKHSKIEVVALKEVVSLSQILRGKFCKLLSGISIVCYMSHLLYRPCLDLLSNTKDRRLQFLRLVYFVFLLFPRVSTRAEITYYYRGCSV
jgi:hypothetical protein